MSNSAPSITLSVPVVPSVVVTTPSATSVVVGAAPQTLISVTGSNPQQVINFQPLGGSLLMLNGTTLFISGGSGGGVVSGSYIQITGSNTLGTANFTGIGGTLVFTSGGQIFISGGAGGGGSYDALGTAANTGQTLYSIITSFSGQSNFNFATTVNVTQTGVTLTNQVTSLSGFSTTFSGSLQTELNTTNINIANETGLRYTQIIALSGITTGASGALFTQIVNASGTQIKVTGLSLAPSMTLSGISGMIVTTSGSFILFNASQTPIFQPVSGSNLTLMAGSGVQQNIILQGAGSGSVLIFNTGGVMDVGLVHSDLTVALGSNDVKTTFYGYLHQTGSPSPGVGHGIGGLFRSQDTSGSSMPLIGTEGRVDAYGYATAYASVALNSTFIGNSFSGTLYGATVSALAVYSGDGATPLPSGLVVGYYCPPIVGGASQYSFFGNNVLRVNSYIEAFDVNGANAIYMYDDGTNGNIATTAGSIILTPASSVVEVNCALMAPLTNGALLGQAGNAWNVTSTQLVSNSGSFTSGITLSGNQLTANNSGMYLNGALIPTGIVTSITQTGQALYSLITGGSGNFTPLTIPWNTGISVSGYNNNLTYRCLVTGNIMIEPPSGAIDGARVKFWLIASGNGTAWNLSMTGIKIPSSSAITWPQAITSGTKTKVLLEYDSILNGGQWELTSFIQGF